MCRSVLLVVAVLGAVIVGSEGGVAFASYPGENGRLVVVDILYDGGVCGGWNEIFTVTPDGTERTRLTFDGGRNCKLSSDGEWFTSFNTFPAWSPTGDAIAYLHDGGDGNREIRLMDPIGRSLGVVTNQMDAVSGLSWSPDGRKLAVIAGTPDSWEGIWIVRVADGEAQILVSAPSDVGLKTIYGVEWSPAGDVIAVEGHGAGDLYMSIHLISIHGGPAGWAGCGGTESTQPEWSPDGRSLYCSSYGETIIRNSHTALWESDPTTLSTHLLASLDSHIYQATSSPDGSAVVFRSAQKLWRLDPSLPGQVTAIASFSGWELDWQPINGTFWDDENSVFNADIEWMAAEGITKGCNPPINDRFCPDSVVTRGQMAAFLVRALNLKERLDNPFTDDDDSIFEADIDRLAAAGITKGCNPSEGNTKFCPDGKVTREQMAAFLVRALHYTDDGGGDLFSDDDDSIFEGDIDRLGTAGVTKGCNPPTNDRYCPTGNVTRGQMAAFLHRALS